MSTNSNISPLVRSAIALLTILDSDMSVSEMNDPFEEFYAEFAEAANNQDLDPTIEFMYLCIAIGKFALWNEYDELDTIHGNFSGLLEHLSTWLESESIDRTIYDANDIEFSFADLVNDTMMDS